MTINENLVSFAGRPVDDWRPGQPVPDLSTTALRLRVDVRSHPEGKAEALLVPILEGAADEVGDRLEALVIGSWGSTFENDSGPVVAWLADHAHRFPSLRALSSAT